MAGPLEGIRVVEFTNGQPDAQIGQMLADYGAEVIMVEPVGGTPLRQQFSFPIWARGKRSVELDLKTQAGLQYAHRLVGSSDVLVQAWRPGVAERLGLGFDAMAQLNPRLVYSSIDAWGTLTKYKDAPGYEGLIQARLGHFNSLKVGRPGPAFIASSFASIATTLMSLQGIVAALIERESSGMGQKVSVSMAHAIAGIDIAGQMTWTLAKRFSEAFTSASPYDEDFNPASSFYAKALLACTRDGYFLQFSQLQAHHFNAFITELGLDHLRADPEWETLPDFDSAEKNGKFLEIMLTAARLKTLADWQEIFDRNPDVFAEVFRHGSELLHHPQILHDRSTVEVADPAIGSVLQIGPNVRMDKTPTGVASGAPLANADHELIRHLGQCAERTVVAPGTLVPSGLPLEGITVLEFGVYFAGPFGATWLTDLGARVIKVEPLQGDPARLFAGFPESGAAKALQGKESLALDLTSPECLAIVHDLVRTANLVLCSFRGGAAERLGIGPADLQAINPDLTYLSAAGFGVDGPYAKYPAYAMTISAGSGMALRNFGPPKPREAFMAMDAPTLRRETLLLSSATTAGSTNPDGIAGMTAAIALALGAYAQRRGVGGQTMYTSMSVSTAALLSDSLMEGQGIGNPNMADPEVLGFNPLYRLYESAKGWIFLATPTRREAALLVTALSDYSPLSSAEWFDEEGHVKQLDATVEALAAIFVSKTAQEWEDELLAHGLGCMAVPPEGLIEREIFGEFGESSGFVTEVYSPIFEVQDRLTPVVRFSRSSTQALGNCIIGQHTAAILKELGRTNEEIAELVDRQLVVAL